MSRALVILRSKAERERAKSWIDQAPTHTSVEFKKPRRSLPQNDRMWAMLTDVAEHFAKNGGYHGLKLTPEDFKDVFTASLKRELRQAPNLDGTGFVLLGQRTSEMSVSEMADLITLIEAFGAAQGVVFKEKVG